MTWRVGRKLARTLYEQAGPEPSDNDRFLGIMETPKLAGEVVASHGYRDALFSDEAIEAGTEAGFGVGEQSFHAIHPDEREIHREKFRRQLEAAYSEAFPLGAGEIEGLRHQLLTDEAIRDLTKQIVEESDGEVISLPYGVVKAALESVMSRFIRNLPQPPAGEAERLQSRLEEFDAWLSFRADFAEVLRAFRQAFGTDTRATALLDSQGDQERCPNAHRYVNGSKKPCLDCTPAPGPDECTCDAASDSPSLRWHQPTCPLFRNPDDPAPTQVEGEVEYRVNDALGIHGPFTDQVAAEQVFEACIAGRSEDTEIRRPVIEFREVGPWRDNEYGDRASEFQVPSPEQPEGGDEEDWPEIADLRPEAVRQADPDAYEKALKSADWGEITVGRPVENPGHLFFAKPTAPIENPSEAVQYRRYIPVSQDSSGLGVEWWEKEARVWREAAEKHLAAASKAEAERDEATRDFEAKSQDYDLCLAGKLRADEDRKRYENALEELAAEFELEAESIEVERLKSEAESAPGTTEGFQLRARAESRSFAAQLVREKAAKLKGECDGDRG